MGQIIAIHGAGSSGKSTFAVNLATALAQQDKIVTIVNCDMNVGSLQTFFGETIDSTLGIPLVFTDKAEMPDRFIKQVGKIPNIYLLSCPNEKYDLLSGEIEASAINAVFRKLSLFSDFVIIDCTSDLYNELTLRGLQKADKIFLCYRYTINHLKWHQSHIHTFERFSKPIIYVLNEHDNGCLDTDFISASKIEYAYRLPDIYEARFMENEGSPMQLGGKRYAKYTDEIKKIAATLI